MLKSAREEKRREEKQYNVIKLLKKSSYFAQDMVQDNARKGFTLAEVLVTLAVIGVVAALTLPALENMQNKQYKAAFKSKYSKVAQLAQRLMSDNGGTMQNIVTGGSGEVRTIAFGNLLKDNLNYIKYCTPGSTLSGNCWSNNVKTLGPNGDAQSTIPSDPGGFILNDGSFMIFHFYYPMCDHFTCNQCGTIQVDVNGFKGPNQWGRDIYGMYIVKNGIVPFGFDCGTPLSTYIHKNCVTSGSYYTWDGNRGYSCAFKVINNQDY